MEIVSIVSVNINKTIRSIYAFIGELIGLFSHVLDIYSFSLLKVDLITGKFWFKNLKCWASNFKKQNGQNH